mgnify:CR=1 FL=1
MEQRIVVKDKYNVGQVVRAEVTSKFWGNAGRTLYGYAIIGGNQVLVTYMRRDTWECRK